MKPGIHSSIVAVPLLLVLTISFVAGTVQTPAALAPQAKAERCCAKELLDIVPWRQGRRRAGAIVRGQQQRVASARALANNPHLLFRY